MRESIFKGTTPSIIFTFKKINVADVTYAYLTIKQSYTPVIECDISTAVIDTQSKTISWTLTQEQTLSLDTSTEAVIFCDWVLNSGIRGAVKPTSYDVVSSGKDIVIGGNDNDSE